MQGPVVIALIGLVALIFWIGGLFVMSIVGPWRELTLSFPVDESVIGTSHSFVSLMAGLVSYSNCLTAVSNADQLTLKLLLPFRPFHAPITLPRSAVSDVAIGRFLFVPTVSFFVDGRQLRLFGSVAKSEFWYER